MPSLFLTKKELEAVAFAVAADLETVMQNPEEWSIGEVVTLHEAYHKIKEEVAREEDKDTRQ